MLLLVAHDAAGDGRVLVQGEADIADPQKFAAWVVATPDGHDAWKSVPEDVNPKRPLAAGAGAPKRPPAAGAEAGAPKIPPSAGAGVGASNKPPAAGVGAPNAGAGAALTAGAGGLPNKPPAAGATGAAPKAGA
eukprot:345521_1